MISKELFIETMTRLEDLSNKMDAVDDALKNLSPDFGGFYILDFEDIVINLLQGAFHDEENEWLSYLVYERDWLKDFTLGNVTTSYGEAIDLSTWDKVYDFLIENMED